MGEIHCYYHHDITAVNKCEQCGKSICLDCVRISKVRHSGGRHSSGYTEKFELCAPCHFDRIQNTGIGMHLFLILFGSVFALFPLISILSFPGVPGIALLFISVFVFAGIGVAYKGLKGILELPRKKEEARQEKELFLNSLQQTRVEIPVESSSPNPTSSFSPVKGESGTFFCQQCGKTVSKDAAFCSHCGDSTEDEKALM